MAFGAAVQAAILTGNTSEETYASNIVLLDVAPFTLGLETAGGVLTRGAHQAQHHRTVPTRKEQVFSTSLSGQPDQIFEDRQLLGKFDLTGIPPAPRGTPQIHVAFDVDANGILNVSANDQSTNTRLTITSDVVRLSKEQIEEMIKTEELFAKEDEANRKRVEVKNRLEEYCSAIKQLVHAITSWLEDNAGASCDEVKEKRQTLSAALTQLISAHRQA